MADTYETLAQRAARYAKEDEAMFKRIKDFGIGVVKGITTDLPGFIADVADKLAGDTAVLGEKDRSTQLFSKLTGVEPSGSPTQKLGEVTNPSAILKSIMVPALAVKGLPAVRETARALAKDPRKAEELFRETGIFASPSEDGILRAVIDDAPARLNPASSGYITWANSSERDLNFMQSGRGPVPLPDMLDHPALYKAIPGLNDTRVGSAGLGSYKEAFYNPTNDYIGIGAFTRPDDFMEALLHEVQHAVQNKAGMSQGGNPNQFLLDPKGLKLAIKRLEEMKSDAFKALKIDASRQGEKIYNISPAFAQSSSSRRLDTVRTALDRLREVESLKTPSYKRIAGEAEARATERMFREGAGKYPLAYYDIPLTSIIESAGDIRKLDDDPVVRAIIESVNRNPKPISPAKK